MYVDHDDSSVIFGELNARTLNAEHRIEQNLAAQASAVKVKLQRIPRFCQSATLRPCRSSCWLCMLQFLLHTRAI